jgi:hypothetical protein
MWRSICARFEGSGRRSERGHITSYATQELKLESFKAADKGQMELYLRWLEKHEMEPGEGTPIGLILCGDKGDERVELLQLDKSGIRVASYLTELPPRQLLRRKLHETLVAARARLADREEGDTEMPA